MPKKCLICKIEPNLISDRSFHMFPKNESLRKKWLDALNLSVTPNFKTAYICSHHFHKNSFYPPDGCRIRKRLCPEAVPKNRSSNPPDLTTESVTKDITTIEVNDLEENDILNHISLELNIYNKSEMCTSNESFKNSLDEVSDDSNFEAVNEEDLFNDFKSNVKLNNYSNSNKRKQSFVNIKETKRVRFIDGFETKYISQEDFVSNEAWARFLKFVAYKNAKLAAAHNKNSRKEKKIKICLELIARLLKKEEENAVNN